jgi:uncharacterized OB-fold protein
MTAIAFRCRQCGQEYAPTRADVVRWPSHYRFCPACRPQGSGETRCERCGRVLRAGRTLCLSCAELSPL